MTMEQGKKELIYVMTMTTALQALEKGWISKDTYAQFHAEMTEKFRPVFGPVWEKNSLLYTPL